MPCASNVSQLQGTGKLAPTAAGGRRDAILPSVPRSVVILGAGPAGASLAAHLRRGPDAPEVVLFDPGTRPELVVGESLVPAVIPFLSALGVEKEVASYSMHKPGAIFRFDPETLLAFRFDEVRGAFSEYAYNVPRDRFDRTLLEAALRSGARLVRSRARLERDGSGDRVRLSEESLEQSGLSRPPDFIVDAGGRGRSLARLLDLPTTRGDRRDTALHAHLEGVELIRPGDIHTDRLSHGWSWRIPLPGRVSLGLVMDPAALAEFGGDPESQYDAYLRHEPMFGDWGATAKRITPVLKYTNYQLRSERGVGENWALVGDAFGFVDPVFSSGMLIALDGAWSLARALRGGGGPRELADYETRVQRQLACWHRVVGWFYDGRLFTLFKLGDELRGRFPWSLLEFHFGKHFPRVVTGEATTNPYSLGLLDFMVHHGLRDNDPQELAVR